MPYTKAFKEHAPCRNVYYIKRSKYVIYGGEDAPNYFVNNFVHDILCYNNNINNSANGSNR